MKDFIQEDEETNDVVINDIFDKRTKRCLLTQVPEWNMNDSSYNISCGMNIYIFKKTKADWHLVPGDLC